MKMRPHITEKSVELAKKGAFTVIVDGRATKPQLVNLAREVFKVNVESVVVLNKKPLILKKAKGLVKDRGFKKAILTLRKGEVLAGYESFLEQKKDKSTKGDIKAKKVSKKVSNKND